MSGARVVIKDSSWSRVSICWGLVAAALHLLLWGEVQIVITKATVRSHEE